MIFGGRIESLNTFGRLCRRLASGALLLASLAFLAGTFLTFATARTPVIEMTTAGEEDSHFHADGTSHSHVRVKFAGSVPDFGSPGPGEHEHDKPSTASVPATSLPPQADAVAFRPVHVTKILMADSPPPADAGRGHPERPPRTETL